MIRSVQQLLHVGLRTYYNTHFIYQYIKEKIPCSWEQCYCICNSPFQLSNFGPTIMNISVFHFPSKCPTTQWYHTRKLKLMAFPFAVVMYLSQSIHTGIISFNSSINVLLKVSEVYWGSASCSGSFPDILICYRNTYRITIQHWAKSGVLYAAQL